MDRNRVTIIAIVLAIIIGLIILIYAAIALVGGFGGDDEVATDQVVEVSNEQPVDQNGITVATTTTLFVDPRTIKTGPNVNAEGDVTPVAPAPAKKASGGFFSNLFSSTPKDIPVGYSERDFSPQFRSVRINGVKPGKGTSPDTVTIRENIGSDAAAIIMTGWTVKTNRDSFTIPKAARVYTLTGAPLETIKVGNNQSLVIYSSASPVNANFMMNKCVPYLSKTYSFVPAVGGSCPKPQKSEIATFTGACQDYILKLGACEEGNPYDSRIPSNDPQCRNFVSSISYAGCVSRYKDQADFLTGQWTVWAGRSFMDPLHDRVLLLDSNGKLVDWYVY